MLVDGFDVDIAVALEIVTKRCDIQRLPSLQYETCTCDIFCWGQSVHQCWHWHNHDAFGQVRQSVKCVKSLRDDVLMG